VPILKLVAVETCDRIFAEHFKKGLKWAEIFTDVYSSFLK
jgi:hypothetical protein